jgi:uncharacterized Tic20 family protein
MWELPLFLMEAKMSHSVDTHSVIGMIGTILSISLSQINTIVSLAVGLVTLFYMIVKTARLLNQDKDAIQQSDSDKG